MYAVSSTPSYYLLSLVQVGRLLNYYDTLNEGVVSKETVVLRRWGSNIQKFGFINGVDKCKLATVQRF